MLDEAPPKMCCEPWKTWQHQEVSTPQCPWITHSSAGAPLPETAFLTSKENFLHFDCARCPLWALLRRACPLRTPRCSQPPPKTPPPPSGAPHLLGGTLMGRREVGKDSEGVCSPPQPSGGWASARSGETQDLLTQIFDHSDYPLLSCTKHYLHAGIKFLLCHPHPLTPHCSRLPMPPSPQDRGRTPFSQSMG